VDSLYTLDDKGSLGNEIVPKQGSGLFIFRRRGIERDHFRATADAGKKSGPEPDTEFQRSKAKAV
jgi:hypothetical protein